MEAPDVPTWDFKFVVEEIIWGPKFDVKCVLPQYVLVNVISLTSSFLFKRTANYLLLLLLGMAKKNTLSQGTDVLGSLKMV